jgi:hypothetical protein
VTSGRLTAVTSVRGAAAVLDFQMWCWGQDVLHPAGNQLLAASLTRVRPPAGRSGSTLYQTALPGGRTLCLWGFAVGVLVPEEPCLVLKRHSFALRLVSADRFPVPLWQPTALPRGQLARQPVERETARAHFVALAEWIATYEQTIGARLGRAWRFACADRRPRQFRHRLPARPDQLAQSWLALRDHLPTVLPSAEPPPVSLAS